MKKGSLTKLILLVGFWASILTYNGVALSDAVSLNSGLEKAETKTFRGLEVIIQTQISGAIRNLEPFDSLGKEMTKWMVPSGFLLDVEREENKGCCLKPKKNKY